MTVGRFRFVDVRELPSGVSRFDQSRAVTRGTVSRGCGTIANGDGIRHSRWPIHFSKLATDNDVAARDLYVNILYPY